MGSTGTRCIEKKAKDRVDDSGRSRLVMAIDKDAIEKHIRGILVALGDDPTEKD